jgi:hypothetical protein
MGRVWVWGSSIVPAAALFVACGGGADDSAQDASPATPSTAVATTTTATPEDVDMTGADFPNINTLTPVGNHFVGNLSGHLGEALAVATAAAGGEYPVGTIIQLVPQEAMVKRAEGWSPATNDWEFFSLDVSAEGTTILTRGKTNVVNRFDMNCMACHAKADPQWDFVCDKTHGCDPLPLTDDIITALQAADPRPKS